MKEMSERRKRWKEEGKDGRKEGGREEMNGSEK